MKEVYVILLIETVLSVFFSTGPRMVCTCRIYRSLFLCINLGVTFWLNVLSRIIP